MAPWRPLGGLWRPWGALGRPRQIFERFWELFGVPSEGPKSVKKALKNELKSNIDVAENELKFVWFSRGPKGRQVSLMRAPLGYDRTAGEG